jgi:hypothetical protein
MVIRYELPRLGFAGVLLNEECRSMSTFIAPHIHMISRVADDYHCMSKCGCVAISEPAFWAGRLDDRLEG